MKKIITVLITSALLIGCGLTDKGMDRKLDFEGSTESGVEAMKQAIDESSPSDAAILQQYLSPALEYAMSNHNGSDKSNAELKDLASNKSMRELMIDYVDSRIAHYTSYVAVIEKAKAVELKIESIQPLDRSYLQTVLVVKNPTDLTIEGFDLEGNETKFIGKDLSVQWYEPPGGAMIKPGESISIPIRGLLKGEQKALAEDPSIDFNALPSETNLTFRNLHVKFKEGGINATANPEIYAKLKGARELKAKLSGDSKSNAQESVAASVPSPKVAQTTNTQSYKYEPTAYTLKGVLQLASGETPEGEKVTFQAIKLEQPITVQGDNETPTEKDLTLMQIVLSPDLQQAFKSLEGQPVSITGTMFHADNSNHKTNVLMTASVISALAQ